MTHQSAIPDEFARIVYNLVAYFIQRQQLVVLAMLELNPRGLDKEALAIEVEPYFQDYRERRKKLQPGESFQSGIWKHDWEYWVHGGGCRLTHLHTSERIEWDGPDPHEFDIYWFMNHLLWRCEHERHDPFIKQLLIWIEAHEVKVNACWIAIDYLADKRFLLYHLDNRYSLSRSNQPERLSLSKDLISVVLNLAAQYKIRQQLAIDVMDSLLSEEIKEINKHTMSDSLALRLQSGYQLAKKKSRYQGILSLDGNWDYDLTYRHQYTRCQLINKHTQEPIAWIVPDPEAIDFEGFKKHLLWEIEHQQDQEDIVTRCCDWIDQYLTELPEAPTGLILDKTLGVVKLLHALVNNHTIWLRSNGTFLIDSKNG